MNSLASKYYRIAPVASLVKKFTGSVSCVKVLHGSFPGTRIHWSPPSDQNFTGANSEQLVNGEVFVAPDGHADEFWISCPISLPFAAPEIFLRAFNCVNPVVVLNQNLNKGGEAHLVGRANRPTLDVVDGQVVLYQDNRVDGSDLDDVAFEVPLSRGCIGGYLTVASTPAQAITAALWARVRPTSNTWWAEIARWEMTAIDLSGTRMSCSFEEGGTSTYRTTATYIRNGPTQLLWPAFGLKLTVEAITGGFSDLEWALFERNL